MCLVNPRTQPGTPPRLGAGIQRSNRAMSDEDAKRLKEHSAALARSEESFRLLVEQAPDGIIVLDLDTNRIVEANPSAEKLFGYAREELLKHDLQEFYTPAQPDELPVAQSFQAHVARAVAGEVLVFERAIRSAQGQQFICEVRVNRLPWAGRNLQRVSFVDITERKRAEDALRRAALYARRLIEASLDPLVTISPEGKITDVNDATVIVTGGARDKLIGSDFSGYFTEPERARAGYQEALTRGFVRNYPLVFRPVSGKTIEVLYNASVYRDENGDVSGVFAAARDVTERRRAERALEALSAGNQALVHSANEQQLLEQICHVIVGGGVRDGLDRLRRTRRSEDGSPRGVGGA
jgi:PAS domain S-box-containing protein